jgi:hypothetical protein
MFNYQGFFDTLISIKNIYISMLYNRVSIYMSIYVIIYIYIYHIHSYLRSYSIYPTIHIQISPSRHLRGHSAIPRRTGLSWRSIRGIHGHLVFSVPQIIFDHHLIYIYIIYPIFNGDLMGLNGTYITMDITMIFLSHEKSP